MIMKTKGSYVAAVGHATVDQYYRCLQKIVVGDKFFVRHIETLPGGMVANVACVLASLCTPTIFLSAFGQDEFTKMLIDSFKPYGVVLDAVDILSYCENFKTSILIEPDGADRTIMLYENQQKPVAIIDDKKRAILCQAAFIYGLISDFRTLPDYRNLLASVQEQGARLMFDVECSTFTSRHDEEDRLFFDSADVLSFNTEAAYKYCGSEDESVFLELIGDTEKIIIVTKGAQGCTVYNRTEKLDFPSFRVKVVDTTGAGDTFNAAFLHALMRGEDIDSCARFATGAANRSVQFLGARSGAVNREQVLTFIKEAEQK